MIKLGINIFKNDIIFPKKSFSMIFNDFWTLQNLTSFLDFQMHGPFFCLFSLSRIHYEICLKVNWPYITCYSKWLGSLTLIPALMNKHIPSKMLDVITYPFPNFNGSTAEVWEWISNFIPHFIMDAIIHPWQSIHCSMRGPRRNLWCFCFFANCMCSGYNSNTRLGAQTEMWIEWIIS